MALAHRRIERARSAPKDADEYYRLLTNRNFHFVSPKAQAALRDLKVLVAGCGSGGGACAEPLIRLGVCNMKMADSGAYELTNYNRQRAYANDIGENKAAVVLSNLRKVNPHANLWASEEGITPSNVHDLVAWADIIFDCVDVTAREALRMKVKLHQTAHKQKKPVLAPLDLGFCQTGIGFDYRDHRIEPLFGKAEAALSCEHPVKALLQFFPLSRFPGHSLRLVEDALQKKPVPISQIGCASDLLSSVAAAATVRFVETNKVVRDWHLDLGYLAQPLFTRILEKLFAPWGRHRVRQMLKRIP